MKALNFKRQEGFGIIMIVLTLAIVLIAIIAFFTSNDNGPDKQTASTATSIAASSLLQQLPTMHISFGRMTLFGQDASTITFDNAATTGLFNAAAGGIVKPVVPADVLATAGEAWVYKKAVKIKGVGADASNDYVFVVPDIKLAVCKSINNIKYGDALTATPPTGAGTLVNWKDGTAGTDTAVDMSLVAAVDGKQDLCIATTDSKYVFYSVVAAN